VNVLVVCPDYASHAFGLLEIAREAAGRGHSVTFATGEAVRPSVVEAGLNWAPLRLGKGHNAGTIRVEEQAVGEDDNLRAFFDATRRGPIETLRYQAEARRHDLLFEPERVLRELDAIVEATAPDTVVVDHVAFGARLAVYALDVPAASVVLGHPTALPAPGELYGLPPTWPAAIHPAADDVAALAELCRSVTESFTAEANEVLARCAPNRPPLDDLLTLTGPQTLFNYPGVLHPSDRPTPDGATFLGSLGRDQALTVDPPTTGDPRVYVSLGSFLGARDDILRTAVGAARAGGWALSLSRGSTPEDQLGELPSGSLVAESLPQVALLDHVDVMVTHGGNNSVTEALRAGVPMVVLPLSTDQFAGAAAIETNGVGVALDPNRLTAAELADAVDAVRRSSAPDRAAAIGRDLWARPGREVAADALAW
jgi:MGT family glycosyltransferase